LEFNLHNNITPQSIKKAIPEKSVDLKDTKHIPKTNIPKMVTQAEKEMREAADRLDFERAIYLREKIKELQKRLHE